MKIIDRWQRCCAVGLGLLLLAATAQAQTNPFAKGPDPTSASLNATAGPVVARALYGEEEASSRQLIELMRLEKDQSLTMEEKAARAQRLRDSMP